MCVCVRDRERERERDLINDVTTGEEDVVTAADCLQNCGSMYLHCAGCQDG